MGPGSLLSYRLDTSFGTCFLRNLLHVNFHQCPGIMIELLMLRHGATHLENCYLGSTDIDIDERGRQQVIRQKDFLAARHISGVICSPKQRCISTCTLLEIPSRISYDQRLQEIDFGEWEGKTFTEIVQSSPELVTQWSRGEDSFTFPQGERMSDFYGRLESFSTFVHLLPAGRYLIISHGGVIRHLICRFLNLPYRNYLAFNVDYAQTAMIKLYDQGGVLTHLNSGVNNG